MQPQSQAPDPVPHPKPWSPSDVFYCPHSAPLSWGRLRLCASCGHQWEVE